MNVNMLTQYLEFFNSRMVIKWELRTYSQPLITFLTPDGNMDRH